MQTMHATFVSSPDDRETEAAKLYGVEFPRGEKVDVSHLSDTFKAKLAGNSTFKVSGYAPAPAKDSAQGDGTGAAPTVKRGAVVAPVGEEVEALRAKLDELGIKYHHMAGVPRLTALLEASEAGGVQ